jgi:hypothetical protein
MFPVVAVACYVFAQVLHSLEGKVTANKWFLPLVWASDITARALEEGKIRSSLL